MVVNCVTRMPRSIEISAGEIYPIAQEVVRRIAAGVTATLGELPPEVAGDIDDRESFLLVVARCLVVWTSTYVKRRSCRCASPTILGTRSYAGSRRCLMRRF